MTFQIKCDLIYVALVVLSRYENISFPLIITALTLVKAIVFPSEGGTVQAAWAQEAMQGHFCFIFVMLLHKTQTGPLILLKSVCGSFKEVHETYQTTQQHFPK